MRRAPTALVVFLLPALARAQAPFTLGTFPIGEPGAHAYNAPVIAALDHHGRFYTNCCGDEIVAFTGETARRTDGEVTCPVAADDAPTCFVAPGCICSYAHPAGGTFVVNGNYVGSVFGTGYLLYDGHAGYDYAYGFGVPIVAPRDGMLCKAEEDFINGHFGFATAWDKFHTFYIDHGTTGGSGYASWFLHATDLETEALRDLAPGGCAAVVEGETVARVGNTGTIAPHLHFETRVYEPLDGPEAPTSRGFDPYGWAGATPDPWSDPLENPQAVARTTPVWVGCGNGILEPGEGCDPGPLPGACCAADCQPVPDGAACATGDTCRPSGTCGAGACTPGAPVPAGTPCAADADPCTVDACDGAGACVAGGPPTCAPCERCVAGLGCTVAPAPGCKAGGRARLVVRNHDDDARDRLVWRWTRGASTSPEELGDPTITHDVDVCVYGTTSPPALLASARAPAGGVCAGGAACWTALGNPPGHKGYRYRDPERTPNGLEALGLRPGPPGGPRVLVKGRGQRLGPPALPLPLPALVQVEDASGACWEATHSSGGVETNGDTRFVGRSD